MPAPLPLLIAASVAATPSGPADTPGARTAITAYIRDCEAIWADASVHDRPEVLRFIADDYRGVSAHGHILHKADMAGAGGARAGALYYANVRFPAPAVAIAQGEEWADWPSGREHLIWVDTWLLRGGAWQIVASEDARVPVDQPLQEKMP